MDPIIPFESAVIDNLELCIFVAGPKRTLFDHLLNCTRRVDLHSEQIVKPVDLRRILGKLLPKRIRQIVRWIGGLENMFLLLK